MTHCIIDWAKYREMDWFKVKSSQNCMYILQSKWWWCKTIIHDDIFYDSNCGSRGFLQSSVICIVLHVLWSSQVSLCFLGKVWRRSLWQYLIKSHPCKINRRWRKDQKLPALGETLIWFSLSIRCIINHANLCKLFSKFSKWMKWYLLL